MANPYGYTRKTNWTYRKKTGPHYTKVTPEIIEEIVKLRDEGWSWPKIGEKFNCDHTTACYHYKKQMGTLPKKRATITRQTKLQIKQPEKFFNGRRWMKKPVKMYKDYRQEESAREFIKRKLAEQKSNLKS